MKTDHRPTLGEAIAANADLPLYSRAEVARYFSVCPHTVQRWTRSGALPAVRFNVRLIRYRPSDVRSFIANSNIAAFAELRVGAPARSKPPTP